MISRGWSFAQKNRRIVGLCVCKDRLQGGRERKAGAELSWLRGSEEEPPLRRIVLQTVSSS